ARSTGSIALLFLCSSVAVAQPPETQPSSPGESTESRSPAEPLPATTATVPPLSITVSGGGALGSYMAGHLYFMDLARRAGAETFDPRVFTGTSAGSINALLAALLSCLPPELQPDESAYFKAWTTVRLFDLHEPGHDRPTGALSRRGFSETLELIRGIWNAGLPRECDVLFGAAVTRVRTDRIEVSADFPELPRALETALLRIRGRGMGQRPEVKNYAERDALVSQLLLPVDGPTADPFEAIKELVFASTAFPVGFSPVSVAHCQRGGDGQSGGEGQSGGDARSDGEGQNGGEGLRCRPEDARRALFIDGGVFDNQPLGLAVRAVRTAYDLRANGDVAIAPEPHSRAEQIPDYARFYYVDPTITGYPSIPAPREEAEVDSLFDLLAELLGLISAARSTELIHVFEEHPEIAEKLLVARNYFPPISSVFGGFIDRDFRRFDFYLGMYDAARTVSESRWSRPTTTHQRTPRVEDLFEDASPEIQQAWRPFLCLRATLDGIGEPSSCSGNDMEDFRILLQVSLDRLYDHCRSVREAPGSAVYGSTHRHCNAILRGGQPPRVDGVPSLAAEERRAGDGEGELNHLFRLLAHYGFHFEDLGLRRDEGALARARLRTFAFEVAEDLSDAQGDYGFLVRAAMRLAVDAGVEYQPPDHSIHALFGLGWQIGYSGAVPSARFLRLSAALQIDGLSTLITAGDNYITLTPLGLLEFEITPWSTAIFQLHLALGVGFQFSTEDTFGGGDCDFERELEFPCSRFVAASHLSTTIGGLLRIQLTGLWGPPFRDEQKNFWAIRPMLGVQFDSPF
ncbi:MAG: patatin-like phospholipase family protein, partial [Myxococcota bacterium]